MTTTSPEPSPYAVQLDADERHGILPFTNSSDPVQNYEYMREFVTWLIAHPQSQASVDLRVRAGKFHQKLGTAQTSESEVPSYEEYLELVDAYNTERGYTSPLRSVESGSNAGLEAKLDQVIALLTNPNATRRPSLGERARERFAAHKAAGTSSLHDVIPPTHPAHSSQPPSGPARRKH
jgi:hypothetical protein